MMIENGTAPQPVSVSIPLLSLALHPLSGPIGFADELEDRGAMGKPIEQDRPAAGVLGRRS